MNKVRRLAAWRTWSWRVSMAPSWKAKGISRYHAVDWKGGPIGKVNKAFSHAVTDAELGRDVTPHVLRHTAATCMKQSGVDVNQAAGFLGMTTEILESVYGHHHPGFQEPAFQEEAAAGVSRSRRRTVSAQIGRETSRTDANKAIATKGDLEAKKA